MRLSLTPLSFMVSSSINFSASRSETSGRSMTWEVERCCGSTSASGGCPQCSRFACKWALISSAARRPSACRSINSSLRIRRRPKSLSASNSLRHRLPASRASTRRTGGRIRPNLRMEVVRLIKAQKPSSQNRRRIGGGVLVFIDEELAGIFDNGSRDENQQVTRSIHFRAPPEQRAENRYVAQHRHRLNECGFLPFEHAAHY